MRVEIKCTAPRVRLPGTQWPSRALGDHGASQRVSMGSLVMPAFYLTDPDKTQDPKSVPAPEWASEGTNELMEEWPGGQTRV